MRILILCLCLMMCGCATTNKVYSRLYLIKHGDSIDYVLDCLDQEIDNIYRILNEK